MTNFNKLWTSIAGALLLGLAEFLPDNRLDLFEGIKLVQMLAGAILVGQIANTVINKYAKGVIQAVSASAPVLFVQLADGWQTNQDLWPVLIAAGTALGVIAIPNVGYQFGPAAAPAPRTVTR